MCFLPNRHAVGLKALSSNDPGACHFFVGPSSFLTSFRVSRPTRREIRRELKNKAVLHIDAPLWFEIWVTEVGRGASGLVHDGCRAHKSRHHRAIIAGNTQDKTTPGGRVNETGRPCTDLARIPPIMSTRDTHTILEVPLTPRTMPGQAEASS